MVCSWERGLLLLIECLPSIHKGMGQSAVLKEQNTPGCCGKACNLFSEEVEARGQEVQSHPQLRKELDASLGYLRSYLILKKGKKEW